MLLRRLSTGDRVLREGHLIKIEFAGRRNVLSTCAYNGGYKENLTVVYNYDSSHGKTVVSAMKASSLKEHMRLTAEEIGIDPEISAGMCTAAQMENAVVREMSHNGVTVTAVVTGGIDVNGGRAGDPASWYEKDGGYEMIAYRSGKRNDNSENPSPVSGTINIMLAIDARVSESVMASALMTATEAKTAAIQELILPSRYSRGIATGSGTDKAIIIGNPESEIRLTDAGKHSMLGEMIGRTVLAAVREALDKQTDANPRSQHNVISRMERFGITGERIEFMLAERGAEIRKERVRERVVQVSGKSELVAAASLYAHLLDQMEWGLLDEKETEWACMKVLEAFGLGEGQDRDACAGDMTKALVSRFADGYAGYLFREIPSEL